MNPTLNRKLRLSATWPEVEVLYEDADLLVLNKPAGLLVSHDRWDKKKENLMGLLFAGIREGKAWARDAKIEYIANVHRLDKDTSGVILLAKTKPALVSMVRQFNSRTPRKTYVALAHASLAEPVTTIDLPIGEHPTLPGRSVIDKRGKPARSVVTVVEPFAGFTLVRVEIESGRHHQIRVHMQAVNCPLVGDTNYGGRHLLLSRLKRGYKLKEEGERPLIDRPALHAERLEITQPTTGLALVIEAPWPHDLTVALKYLRKHAKA